jgi:ABC-type antimicrobial peptide transport system permease subunit
VIAYQRAPHRVARRRERVGQRGSVVARTAAARGMPTSAVTGIRFALEPGAGRNAVPVRSAIVGAALAIIVVTGTLTFGASLNHLVSHPALYGWNWTYELSAGQGNGDIPQQRVTQLLRHDHDVAAWSGVYFAALQLDGVPVPVIGANPKAAVSPPILSGHGFDAPNQVVLGEVTLAQLHKHVGDTVVIAGGSGKPTRLRIVGTATMPTIGVVGNSHPTMGTGALLSYTLIPAFARNPYSNPVTGPNNILVRVRGGANPAAALRSLQEIATATSTNANFGVAVVRVQHPAEIVNYRSMGSTPVLLGAALAAGAVAALGLTLIASVRRRRHDLALLKTIGFTRRQLSATIAWQATIAVAIGTVIGIPVGIIIGRSLWDVFARAIDVVPQPTVSAMTIALMALSALVLANVVAAIPARQAANTRTAVLLHAE